mmetsp:Transcript_7342/g.14492  ORF Transcript_7342/g.14492 Transcript_7342/m.14492 type:complete len:84 (-) Transcript_7342:439-690(-)
MDDIGTVANVLPRSSVLDPLSKITNLRVLPFRHDPQRLVMEVYACFPAARFEVAGHSLGGSIAYVVAGLFGFGGCPLGGCVRR